MHTTTCKYFKMRMCFLLFSAILACTCIHGLSSYNDGAITYLIILHEIKPSDHNPTYESGEGAVGNSWLELNDYDKAVKTQGANTDALFVYDIQLFQRLRLLRVTNCAYNI